MNIKSIAVLVITILLIILIYALVGSCRHNTVDIKEFPPIKFNTQILPIFQINCAKPGCHDGISKRGGHYNFSNYNGIMVAVKPGDPDNSTIYNAITNIRGDIMPPSGPLSINQRSLIRIWILQGAKNDSDTTNHKVLVCDTNNITFSGVIKKNLTNNCLICHSNNNAATNGGNVKLEDSADVVAWANGILGSIQHKLGYDTMPKGAAKLDTCSITQFAIWYRKLNDTT